MQNAGLQYGEGVTPVQESPFVTTPVQINSSNSTSSLRQFRKKDNVDKAAGVSGGLSAANSGGTDSTNSSHVARVAPHNHYPHKQNEYFRYPPQYQEYSSPPVKYSEIAEPVIQPIPHLDHLPPSVLTKHKEKEYAEMCNIPQQSHLNKPYPEHQFNGQQSYPPEMSMHHQYMHKEPQGSQIHSPYKSESQYIPKEGAFNHQIPPYLKYNIPQSRNYGPLDNSSLNAFQRMDPHLARSFMADHHHIREFPTEYSPMEQSRMYAQKQRYYPTPLPPSNSTYPPNYPHRNIPAQQYNYPSCNYPRSAQMNSTMGRYPMNMERSISPRRTYSENMDMTMNFPPVPQKIPANYPNYPAYAQHYQQRRPQVVPQEYYHPQQHPHPRAHAQYMPNHHPQEIAENHVASNNIRQYLENWAEEEPTSELPTTIENSKYISRINREEPNEVYVINASELPQYLENGVPLIASENGQYIFKSNVSIDNTGAIKIIDKTVENAVLPTDAHERVVSLHIIENPKTDCLVNTRQSNVNPEHQVATNQAPPATLNLISNNANHANIENTAQRSYNQPGYNTNRMNIHQVSPMTHNNPQNCKTSINLSIHPNATNSPQQINRSNSEPPQKMHGTNTENDQLKIQVLSYNEVPQNSCIVMPSTQNRLNFDESLLPNPVPCDLKQKKNDFEVKTNNNDANSVISNVMNEEAILKEAHEELDKIVQDTLTSTHMPIESCDRSQIPKIEEKCVEENMNSRIPDYLNLDLESHPKDLTSTLTECPMSNSQEPIENEAIMDLSTTSRRTSKSENGDQEIPCSVTDLSNQPSKNKHDQKTDNEDEERVDNKDTVPNDGTNDVDKASMKHMPLIFDGFEEHTIQKNETETDSNDTKIQNENLDTRAISLAEEKKEEVKDYGEVSELKNAEEQQTIPELSESILQTSLPVESNVVSTTGEIKEEEPPVDENKSETDKVLNETVDEIVHDKSTIDKKVESFGNFEVKEIISTPDVNEDITNETTEIDSKASEDNKHSAEDKEEDKTEKEVESPEQKTTPDVATSGIKRKRIFSVDDIIYRIGSTSNQIQNACGDMSDCKKDIQKYSNENKTDDTLKKLKCSSNDETDSAISELVKENSNPQEPYEDLGKHPQENEEKEMRENSPNENEEDKINCTNHEECEESPEGIIEDDNKTSTIEENECPKSDSKEESKSVEEIINKEIIQKSTNTLSEIEEVTTNSDNDIEIKSVFFEFESIDETENHKKNIDGNENKASDNEEIEKMQMPSDDMSEREIVPDENCTEQTEEKEIIMEEIFEEKPNNCLVTELEECASPMEISETNVSIVSEEKVPVIEGENENNPEQVKIKILSDDILVEENKKTISDDPCYSENPASNDDIKTESLKRNLSESYIPNEDTTDDETITENSNKKIKLNDFKLLEKNDYQEAAPDNDVNTAKEFSVDPPPTNPCRFSVIQRTETIHRELKDIVSSEEKLKDSEISNNKSSTVKMEEVQDEEPTNLSIKTEDEALTKEKKDDRESEEPEEDTPPLSDAKIPEELEETSTKVRFPCEPEEHTSPLSDVKSPGEVEEASTKTEFLCEPEEHTLPLSDEKIPEGVDETSTNTQLSLESPENTITPEEKHQKVYEEPTINSKDQSLKQPKTEISFEQRFVEPLLKTHSPETSQKNDHQEEKPPGEDCQYRSVLRIEENMVLLEICGELVEISVNQTNGRKVITVVPISNGTTVDINDNYEHTDRTHINELCISNSAETVQNDAEMPELHEESSMDVDGENQEKKLPVLDKMISSSEDVENVIRNEEITSTQTETIENTEEIFEDIILNENEIIIGDESLEEEINLDLKSDEVSSPEKPVLCTKAAKKLYEDVSVNQPPKPHSSLREFRKIKNKPEQQTLPIEKKNPDDHNNTSKEKKQLKGSTRTSTRQKNVSEQKEESQVALQELVKQRKMRKEKIRLKYPYVLGNTEDVCEKSQSVNTAVVKVRQDKDVRSEIRKVSKAGSNIVKMEKNQVSSVVHKVKSGNEMKRRGSSEIHGTKAKCKEKIRRKSVDEGKEKINIVASVIVKEPYSNIDSDKIKMEEKPTSTSHICSNPTTTSKDASAQNFQEARTSTNMEVAKNSNVQEKHSKFLKTSTPRDLSLTKNINEHYLSRKDHSNLKKKLSIQEYNSRKRKMEESKAVPTPEKIVKVEETSKIHILEKEHGRPSTIYSGRQFENVSNCVKDPRRLQFMNSEHSTLLRTKSEESSSSRAPNISSSRSLSSGTISSQPAITVDPLLAIVSTNNQLKTHNTSIPEKLLLESCEIKPINTNGKKTTETSEKMYEPNKRRVSFDNVQINEIHTTQTKIVKSRQDSNSSYCEVTSSCSDSFEEKSHGDGIHLLFDDKIENTRLEYQNNLVRRIQIAGKFENNWEDSNSPKDSITDAFSDCFLEKSRLESMKNPTKTKLIIDINDFDTSLINNELKGSYKNNSNTGEESLKNYKEEVDIKLNSLNIQIPKTTKNRVLNEDDLLMHKFLRKEQLNSDEIKQIRRIIYFKKKIQQLTQQNVINNNKTTENKYEIKKSPESSSNKDLKLQLKKVDGKTKKKKKRFRNLYSDSPETSETEIQESAGEFSVYKGENISGVKLIFKRKTDFLNLQPVVRLQRCSYIDSMAKKLKFE